VSASSLVSAVTLALTVAAGGLPSPEAERPTSSSAHAADPSPEPVLVQAVAPTIAPGTPADPTSLYDHLGPGTGFELLTGEPLQVELVATWVRDGRPYRALHSVPLTLRPGRRVSVQQALPLGQLGLDDSWTVARSAAMAELTPVDAEHVPQRSWLMITAVPVHLPEQPPTIGSMIVELERVPRE